MLSPHRYVLYLIWHLFAGMLLAFAIAFIILHSFSLNYPELGQLGMVWRTISYVIPKWFLLIIPAGLIFAVISAFTHSFIINALHYQKNVTAYIAIVLLISLVTSGGFLIVIIPIFVGCSLFLWLEDAWDKRFGEKAKRGNQFQLAK